MRTFLTVLAWIAVLLVGVTTATANFRYGWLIGHDLERYIYAIGGTVLDVVKTFLPLMLGTFLAGHLTLGTFARTVAGWSIWVIGVAWSLTCALGLYAISKEAAVGANDGKGAVEVHWRRALGERRRHHRKVPRAHQNGALPKVKIQMLHHRFLDHAGIEL